MEQMKIFRAEIDLIDEEIIMLFAKRFEIINKVGNYKKDNNIQPLQLKRWEEQIQRISILAEQNGLDKDFVLQVWDNIHEYALKTESSIVNS